MTKYGECGFQSCRYNRNGYCTSEPDRKVCLEVTEMVLGKDYEDFKRWKEDIRDDGK